MIQDDALKRLKDIINKPDSIDSLEPVFVHPFHDVKNLVKSIAPNDDYSAKISVYIVTGLGRPKKIDCIIWGKYQGIDGMFLIDNKAMRFDEYKIWLINIFYAISHPHKCWIGRIGIIKTLLNMFDKYWRIKAHDRRRSKDKMVSLYESIR